MAKKRLTKAQREKRKKVVTVASIGSAVAVTAVAGLVSTGAIASSNTAVIARGRSGLKEDLDLLKEQGFKVKLSKRKPDGYTAVPSGIVAQNPNVDFSRIWVQPPSGPVPENTRRATIPNRLEFTEEELERLRKAQAEFNAEKLRQAGKTPKKPGKERKGFARAWFEIRNALAGLESAGVDVPFFDGDSFRFNQKEIKEVWDSNKAEEGGSNTDADNKASDARADANNPVTESDLINAGDDIMEIEAEFQEG